MSAINIKNKSGPQKIAGAALVTTTAEPAIFYSDIL